MSSSYNGKICVMIERFYARIRKSPTDRLAHPCFKHILRPELPQRGPEKRRSSPDASTKLERCEL